MLTVKNIHGNDVYLSEFETTVVYFYMTGMDMRNISLRTGMSEQSVSYFKRKVMRKVEAKNNNELIIWYLSQRAIFKNETVQNNGNASN